MVLVLVLLMAPVAGYTDVGHTDGSAVVRSNGAMRCVLNGGVSWLSDGVVLGGAGYDQSVYLVSTASTILHAPGAHLGLSDSQTTIRLPANIVPQTIDSGCGCNPAVTTALGPVEGSALSAGWLGLGTLAGHATPPVGAVMAAADVALLGIAFYNDVFVDHGAAQVNFHHYGPGLFAPSNTPVNNLAKFHVNSPNTNPAAFTAEWKYSLAENQPVRQFGFPTAKYYSAAVRLHRGQLPLKADGHTPILEGSNCNDHPEYGFGLAGIERPLWTPSYP